MIGSLTASKESVGYTFELSATFHILLHGVPSCKGLGGTGIYSYALSNTGESTRSRSARIKKSHENVRIFW